MPAKFCCTEGVDSSYSNFKCSVRLAVIILAEIVGLETARDKGRHCCGGRNNVLYTASFVYMT